MGRADSLAGGRRRLGLSLDFLVAQFSLFLFLTLTVAPVFKQMLTEFQLRLPLPTEVFFSLSDVWMPLTLSELAVVVLGLVAVRLFGGRRAYSQLMGAIPIVGKLWYWSGSAEGLRALGLLVENQIPLPQAPYPGCRRHFGRLYQPVVPRTG